MPVQNTALVPTLPGQIARIHLENFMTYDSIDVKPGYHLNFIVGPNGTGKSAIVCAVILGLGGRPKYCGRADQVSSFVKSGCDQSIIEIELFNGKDNHVTVKRQISSNNHSQFYVNNAVATINKINQLRIDYKIQIDNLCTFLPQEKVQDFAKLNPHLLLENTEMTVDMELMQKHMNLKNLRGGIIQNEKYIQSLEEQVESEKQKNARIEDKVNQIREKKSLHERLVLLNQKRAWLRYHEVIAKRKEVEDDTKLAQRAYDDKKRKLEEVARNLKNLEDNIKEYQQKLTDSKREENGKRSVVDDRLKRAQRKIEDLEDVDNYIEKQIAEEESKKQEMRIYETDVDKLKNDLRTLLAEIGSEQQFNAQDAAISKELNDIKKRETNISNIKADLEEDVIRLGQGIRNIQSERARLERKRNARLEYVRNHEPDVYRGMMWLKDNRNLFRGMVYNPIIIEMDVPNPEMAKYVEAKINYRDLIAFTCTNPEDMNLLIRKLRTEMHLKVNVVCSDEEDQSQYFPAVSMNQLRPLGFFAFLKDLITAPEPIVRFLCKSYKIHNVPVGDESVKDNCAAVPSSINSFYSKNHAFTVKVSSYSGDKSTSVRPLSGRGKYFVESVDERKLQELVEAQRNHEHMIQMKNQEITDFDQQLNELRRSVDAIKNKRKEWATKMEEKTRINVKLKRAQAQVESIRKTLRDTETIYGEAEIQRQTLRRDIDRRLQDLKDGHESLDKASENRRQCDIIYKTSRFGIETLVENKKKLTEETSRTSETLELMKERLREATNAMNRAKEEAREETNGVAIGERGFKKFEEKFKELKNTVDELDEEIQETQTKADFLRGGSADILKEFEQREEHITQLGNSINSSKNDLEKKKEELAQLREGWLVPVTELVEKINKNFENFFTTMGCAGEVDLLKPENMDDYEEYGIKIRVKFRDGVPLQELSRTFQSGGERAVSTAIYMLSLQELTSVPFRFVDEINQGMDPANERRIIDLIVKVTAPVTSTQYFFITPKLLPGIKCSNTVSTLCIYNGPSALTSQKWNLQKFLKRAKGVDHNDSQSQESQDSQDTSNEIDEEDPEY